MKKAENGITIVGLGPGDPAQITRQVWDWLLSIGEVYVRSEQHPTVAGLPGSVTVHSFDEYYQTCQHFAEVYERIVARVLELGRRSQGVTYAVPGHPYVAEATSPEIVRRARQMGIPVRILDGLSFLEPTFTALGIDPLPHLALVDALEVGQSHTPPFPPSAPALIAQIYSRQVASELKLSLLAVYPDQHPVRLVHAAGTSQELIEDLRLYEIDRSAHTGLLTALYLPPLAPDTSFEAFQEVVAHLRAPDGCPWDREQTHQSLRKYLLEEAYEALGALDAENAAAMQEEFGDLLLQIVLHAQIASESGEFTMADVISGISRKLIRRHPHVFSDMQVDNVSAVLTNWERIKEAERKNNGDDLLIKGLLDGVPRALPALSQAQELQHRAARVGFDWPDISPVIAKVREELAEVLSAEYDPARAAELGDLLFAVVNLVRWYGADAESALRQTNERFRRRFGHIEEQARAVGRSLTDMSLEEMDVFWDQAKDLD
ncbi:MAG: nucleoside triphosphate pyrophosphohydrolase [Anaerolineaceae bacterium]|jgi:tetrapyrrole methylase family protein/MazG family protein